MTQYASKAQKNPTNEVNTGLVAARYSDEAGYLEDFYRGFTETPSNHPMYMHAVKVLTRVIRLRKMEP